jgi:hypothetical protein
VRTARSCHAENSGTTQLLSVPDRESIGCGRVGSGAGTWGGDCWGQLRVVQSQAGSAAYELPRCYLTSPGLDLGCADARCA